MTINGEYAKITVLKELVDEFNNFLQILEKSSHKIDEDI